MYHRVGISYLVDRFIFGILMTRNVNSYRKEEKIGSLTQLKLRLLPPQNSKGMTLNHSATKVVHL